MRSTKAYRVISTPVLTFLALLLCGATTITAAPGDLDPTFGVGGKLIDGSGYGSYDVAIQSDGKIVVVGSAAGGSEGTRISVARYNIDGSPDTSFGRGGRMFIDHYQIAVDVAVQPDGKIVVASRDPDGDVYGELVRLNSDGSLDTSFGTSGIVEGVFLPSIAAILPDGRLLIALAASLFRLNANGSFDTTFGHCKPGGSTVHYLYNRSESVIQPDGRILTAFSAGSNDFGVFRCNPEGTLDNGFGSGGVVITPVSSGNDVAQSIAIQMDGKIVVTGQSQSNANTEWKLTAVRYNTNGSLDSGFGIGGIVTTPTGITYWNPQLNTVAIQTDGKIVASTTIQYGSNSDFAIVRYNPNGLLDTTFGGGDGIATVDFGGPVDNASGMKLDDAGRAVVIGESGSSTAIARLLSDPTPTPTVTPTPTATPTPTCPNPIDCNGFFVRQQYQDFLNREPDAGGLAYWTDQITQCGSDARCIHERRIGVSAAFFVEMEFQNSGYYVYRFYKASFGRQPNYSEFTSDRGKVTGGAKKQAFANEWVQRPAFVSAYPLTLSNTEVVNKLFDSAGLTASIYEAQRQQEILAMNSGRSRALVLRDVIETADFKNIPEPNDPRYDELKQISQYNPAFVLMQYFGYLSRNIDPAGYAFWLDVVNNREPNNYGGMVCAFITSSEYQQRFGSTITRSNSDCSQ